MAKAKNTYATSGRKYYLKKRAEILKKARAYYKKHRTTILARMKKYHKRTKGKPLYLANKKGGKRPLFARVTAHNRRNGKFKAGVKGTAKGRKPAKSGVAFKKAAGKKRA